MISFSVLLHFSQFGWLSEVLGVGYRDVICALFCRHPLWTSKDTSLDLLSNIQVSFEGGDVKMPAFFLNFVELYFS